MISNFTLHDGTKVHLYNIDKFKTISIRFIFPGELDNDKYMAENVLASMLSKSNKEYKEEKDFVKYLRGLYKTSFSTYYSNHGSMALFNIGFSIINNKYIDEDINLLEKAFDTANNVFTNADLTIEKFEKEKRLYEEKYNGNLTKRSYAFRQFRKLMFDYKLEDPYRNRQEDIKKVTYEDILNAYQNLFNRPCEILIVGDITEEEIKSAYGNYLFNHGTKKPNLYYTHRYVDVKEPKIEIENTKSHQSHLCMGFRTNIFNSVKEKYAFTILNYMLGGDSFSTLFQEIREKRSLAYNVSVSADTSRTMFIYTAINSEDYEETVKVINDVLEDYRNGNIDKEVFEMSKLALFDGTITEYDRIGYYSEFLFSTAINNGEQPISLEKRTEIAEKITLEDISELCQKIKLDTSYFLRGEL